MRKILKRFAVVLLFIGFIQSCEDEPVQINNWTQLEHGTNDFIKRESINNYPNVMSYAKDLAKPVRSDLVRTEDDNASFTILEHIDAYIFTDSLTTTYTIPILKANQTEFGFSNLLIKYVDDTPVEEFILNYVPTQNYLNNYLEYEQTPFEGTILYEKLLNDNARTIECTQITTTYCCFVYGVPELGVPNFCGANHIAGTNCNTSDYITTVTSTVCTSTSQDFTIDAGDSGGGGGNGSPTTPIPTDTCSTARGDVGLSNGDGCLEPENPSDDDDCTVSNEDFNAYYSELSPFDVDLGLVREGCDDTIDMSAVEANQKFMCIYNKLIESPEFKNLFVNTFSENDKINVKFKTVPNIEGANGITGLQADTENNYSPSTGEVNLNLLIQIDQGYMSSYSAIAVAKTILHECIHAYLILKHIKCNSGTPFDEIMDDINDKKLEELLNYYYDNSCSGEEQHEFMYNEMIPTMSSILGDIRDDLIPENHQTAAESDSSFFDENNPAGDTVLWNWNDFFKYLSSSGLHQTDAFQWEIPSGSPKHNNYLKYSINYGKNLFRKECND